MDEQYQRLLDELDVYQRALKDLNTAFMQREVKIRELKEKLAKYEGKN